MNSQGFWAALEAFSLAGWEDLLIDRPWAFLLFPVALGAAAAMMMPKRRLARLIFPRLDMVKRLPKGRGLWHFHGARVSLVLVGLLMVLASSFTLKAIAARPGAR